MIIPGKENQAYLTSGQRRLDGFQEPCFLYNNLVEWWEPFTFFTLHPIIFLCLMPGTDKNSSVMGPELIQFENISLRKKIKLHIISSLGLGGNYQDTCINTKSLKMLLCEYYTAVESSEGSVI